MPSPFRYNKFKYNYDVIGDIHGCYEELVELFYKLQYNFIAGIFVKEGHMPVFCGDLTDRGPYNVKSARLIMDMVREGRAYYVPGNHCNKLYRYLIGKKVQVGNGLEVTALEISELSLDERNNFTKEFIKLYENSSFYIVLDNGRLVVSHAGIKEIMIGKISENIKTQCLYGDVTGEKDETGFPIRLKWYMEYKGNAINVYGHTPEFESVLINNTLNIDQGCVFGWRLAAFCYPKNEIVTVASKQLKSEEQWKRMENLAKERNI